MQLLMAEWKILWSPAQQQWQRATHCNMGEAVSTYKFDNHKRRRGGCLFFTNTESKQTRCIGMNRVGGKDILRINGNERPYNNKDSLLQPAQGFDCWGKIRQPKDQRTHATHREPSRCRMRERVLAFELWESDAGKAYCTADGLSSFTYVNWIKRKATIK